jgi:polar amino acid transport system ATP-binding protein
MNPRVIYFDEATSALDPKLTKDMHRLIRELATDGMAVGIVTHEMGFARDVSDRICLLYDGQIIEEGTPDEVINHPKNELTKEFLSHVED